MSCLCSSTHRCENLQPRHLRYNYRLVAPDNAHKALAGKAGGLGIPTWIFPKYAVLYETILLFRMTGTYLVLLSLL